MSTEGNMQNKKQFLYQRLLLHGSAPDYGFDKFVVGPVSKQSSALKVVLHKLLEGSLPSCGNVVLGPNGNGKTLLNRTLQAEASSINKAALRAGDRGFQVLFSRVSLSHGTSSHIGLELANNLQRILGEPPEACYGAMVLEVFRQFVDSKPMVYWAGVGTLIARYMIRRTLGEVDDLVEGILSEEINKKLSELADPALQKLQRRLQSSQLKEEFKAFASSQKFGKLAESITSTWDHAGSFSSDGLRSALNNDLGGFASDAQSHELIGSLGDLAGSIGCEVLVVQVDDCNRTSAADFLLPLAEHMASFANPRVMILASGLEAKWQEIIESQGNDKSFYEKVDQTWEKHFVSPPNSSELDQLADRLDALVSEELGQEGHLIQWPEAVRTMLLEKLESSGDEDRISYRRAAQEILKSVLQHVKVTF